MTSCELRTNFLYHCFRHYQIHEPSFDEGEYLVTLPTDKEICAVVAEGYDEEGVRMGLKGSEIAVRVS